MWGGDGRCGSGRWSMRLEDLRIGGLVAGGLLAERESESSGSWDECRTMLKILEIEN